MQFSYEAYSKEGKVEEGTIRARGKGEALEILLKQDIKPIQIHPKNTQGILQKHIFDSVTTKDLLFFIRNLTALLRSGMGATESLELIIEDIEKPSLKRMLQSILRDVRSGKSFTKAFVPFAKKFPPMFLGLLEAGELSGKLDETLMVFADYLERSHSFRAQLRSAMIYPTILVIASFSLSVLMLTVLVPRLGRIFLEANIELPAITRFMIAISDALTWSPLLDMVIVGCCVCFVMWVQKTTQGRRVFDMLLLRTPVIRDITKRSAVVWITRTLGTLLQSGVGIIQALPLAGKASTNLLYKDVIADVTKRVTVGASFSSALRHYERYFPRTVIGMIGAAEVSGNLSKSLNLVADFYEQEVQEALKRMNALIEPLLILVMGVVVGVVALSVILPIYQLINTVQ